MRVAAPGPVRRLRLRQRGSTLRKLTYEIQQSDLPKRPSKTRDSFTHHGRRWEISDVTKRDDIGAWWLVVADAGAAT